MACVLLAALATYVVPSGAYDRQLDEMTGQELVVAGTWKPVPAAPVDLFGAMVALPRGLVAAAEVVFLIFLIGGAFTVVDATGTLKSGIEGLVRAMRGADLLVIPIVSLAFAVGGIVENLQEECIAVMPVLVLLTRRLGLPPLAAPLMSVGPAMVGSAFSPMNPFQVGIAQRVAELPLMSGWPLRTVLLVAGLALWITSTMRWARRERTVPARDTLPAETALAGRHLVVLAALFLTFGVLVYGLLVRGWGFNEMSGLFFLMAVVVGLVGGLGLEGTARAYAKGFRDMAYAAVLVGFARAIFVVLSDGRIVDTIVHGLFQPLAGLSPMLSLLGMMMAHLLIHIPVPSVSGHAMLTMPVLVPLSDLLGISRQSTVLAYQCSAGLGDLVIATNGALLAVLAAAGVGYDTWIRWVFPRFLALLALGALAAVAAVSIGYR